MTTEKITEMLMLYLPKLAAAIITLHICLISRYPEVTSRAFLKRLSAWSV
jgi:hypothetical protein